MPEKAIDAALAAYVNFQREARQAVWTSPSREQVRRMLEAASPLITADVCDDIARECQKRGDKLPPSFEQQAWSDAAEVAMKGGLP